MKTSENLEMYLMSKVHFSFKNHLNALQILHSQILAQNIELVYDWEN